LGRAEQVVDAGWLTADVLLTLDTCCDKLRILTGGRLKLFVWTSAALGPAEVDVAFIVQSIEAEGGVLAADALEWYAERMDVREDVLDAAVAAVAGVFGV